MPTANNRGHLSSCPYRLSRISLSSPRCGDARSR